MSKNKKSLTETHPEVAKHWHPTKNGNLTPNDVTKGSNKKIWWKCDKGEDHEWEKEINKRAGRGDGCLICSNRKIVKSNCLSTTHPDIAEQWHPTKNGDLTPHNIGSGSNKKIWWKCSIGDDHEWSAKVYHRSNGIGCPVCSNRKIVKSNCLSTTHPDIAEQWHPTKNGNLTPHNIGLGSHKKIWWKCSIGDDHEWSARVYSRASGCPICSGRKVIISNSLAVTNPEKAKFFHPSKNKNLTPHTIKEMSGKKIWWKCPAEDDHEFFQSPANLKGCPVCSGHRIVPSNSLKKTHPELAKEWHPTKNGDLTVHNVGYGQDINVWWKCDKGVDHEWNVSVNSRTSQGSGCPICSGKTIVLSNSLVSTHPDIAEQWHPIKNGDLTPYNIGSGSHKKIWWKCSIGHDHEWGARVYSRAFGLGCPYCSLTPQSKQELIITFELIKIFKNIDPKGLKTKLEGRLRAIDIFIPKLNLCIEFDGSYWHKDKRDIDKIKSEMLFDEGFKLIRVREEPLEKIYYTDVISKRPYDGKQVTNDILLMIISQFELDTKLISKIKDYQSKEDLQNEKRLERYIDKILTEKTEKKILKQ